MNLKWNLRVHDAHMVQSIERHANVSPIVAQLLAARGITSPEQVATFFDLKMTGLRPPDQLPGIPQAVTAIAAAITKQKRIFVYGDYDADGMTSTAIMVRCLKLLGANVAYFVPSRLDDGYGLSIETLDRLRKRGAEMIISVDCGIGSIKEVEFANSQGIEIVITDHHHPGEKLPEAAAIVHPDLPGTDYPFAGLCGAGVAFKLAWALCTHHHGSPKLPLPMREFLFSAVSLAAIGTVCDVVPMKDENRIIVHHGLNCLRSYATLGLKHLMEKAGCLTKDRLDASDLGWGVGPRLNAAGRLAQAQLGVELLICENENRAAELAEYIDALNKDRKSLEIQIQRSAEKLIEEKFNPERESALVLANDDWHLGVIGIVAGRLAERYQRPTVLISLDPNGERPGVGSCRSACGVDLYEVLSGCRDHLDKFGGHSGAAGVSIEPSKIDEFREDFCQQVVEQVSLDELYQDLDVDAEAMVGHLTISMMNELQKLAPFGHENPSPVLAVKGVTLREVRTMGTEDQHLSVRMEQHGNLIRAVAFGKGEWAESLSCEDDQHYDFAFKPVINDFRGQYNVEMHLIDFRKSEFAC
ncbi:MAG: single-stranded-DNA-specific exonuclease RecJ [Planctomycetota bacterium]